MLQRGRKHYFDQSRLRRDWMIGFLVVNSALYIAQIGLYVAVFTTRTQQDAILQVRVFARLPMRRSSHFAPQSPLPPQAIYVVIAFLNLCIPFALCVAWCVYAVIFAGFPYRSAQARRAVNRINRLVIGWTLGRVVWAAIAVLAANDTLVQAVQAQGDWLFALVTGTVFVVAEAVPYLASLGSDVINLLANDDALGVIRAPNGAGADGDADTNADAAAEVPVDADGSIIDFDDTTGGGVTHDRAAIVPLTLGTGEAALIPYEAPLASSAASAVLPAFVPPPMRGPATSAAVAVTPGPTFAVAHAHDASSRTASSSVSLATAVTVLSSSGVSPATATGATPSLAPQLSTHTATSSSSGTTASGRGMVSAVAVPSAPLGARLGATLDDELSSILGLQPTAVPAHAAGASAAAGTLGLPASGLGGGGLASPPFATPPRAIGPSPYRSPPSTTGFASVPTKSSLSPQSSTMAVPASATGASASLRASPARVGDASGARRPRGTSGGGAGAVVRGNGGGEGRVGGGAGSAGRAADADIPDLF